MKRILIPAVLLVLASAGIFSYFQLKNTEPSLTSAANEIGTKEDPYARQNWELQRMADPATGALPENIYAREAAFAATLPVAPSGFANKRTDDWQQRGPYNIGGRTRAIAIDVDNHDVLLAGSVTGGVYRSEDGGKSWNRAQTPGMRISVTDIIQDTRSGKHHIWYLCTGEIIGNLTRYPGDGIYKSTDGGKTWTGLQIENKPQEYRQLNYSWRMVIDHTRNDSDVLYLASLGAILRSNDGGKNWRMLMGGEAETNQVSGSDIAISSKGVLYATLSSNSPNNAGGLYRSEDGLHWTNIKTKDYPSVHNRTVIEIFKGNENVVFFLGNTPNEGKYGESHAGQSERNSFFRYEYLGGNGADSMGKWENRSNQIPALRQTDGYIWGDFLSQGGYDLICRVNPRNEDSIIIGGTNLFVSTDGFATNNKISWAGGYRKTKDRVDAIYNGLTYPNHHPDQHNLIFHPDNLNRAYSTNDGGLQVTENIWDQSQDVTWTSLNNGYFGAQFYTICINQNPVQTHALSDIMLGGFQDNETQYVAAHAATDTYWERMACCDGSYAHVFDKDEYTYVLASKQLGTIYEIKFDKDGKRLGGNRADPTGASSYLFINPFIANPNAPEKIYLAGGYFIWKNSDISTLPLNETDNTTDWNWTRLTKARASGSIITALDCSVNPANVVYFGTSGGQVYVIDDIESENYAVTDLTAQGKPLGGNGYVSSIAIDPNNANAVLICFSNYNRKSLYYTNDGGQNWRDVSGNLEENPDGTGAGPGCNVVKIIRDANNRPYYLVGTTSGLYSTTGLPGEATVWNREADNTIGNCSVRDIDYRSSDNLLVLGTHGCGSFSTTLDKVAAVPGPPENDLTLYPNPASEVLNYRFNQKPMQLMIYASDGRLVYNGSGAGKQGQIAINNWPAGSYIVKATLANTQITKTIIVE
ncbi:T9SS type A sorting domain-containing protein [bacterium]|nr:T9SS type A sorting domain-containing protein [bacterium]